MSTKKTIEADTTEYRMASNKKKLCKVGIALDLLSEQERTNLVAALEDPYVTATGIITVILKKLPGADISMPAITSHKGGTCSCATKART